MPTYDFKCTECPNTITVSIRITDQVTPPVCADCAITMVRQFGLAAVTFKGTGWGKDA